MHTYTVRIYGIYTGDLINTVPNLSADEARNRVLRTMHCGNECIVDRSDCRPGRFEDAGKSILCAAVRLAHVGAEQFAAELSLAMAKMEAQP